MDTTGNKIRIQRLTRNYSQEYMAFSLGISQPAYSKIERDETDLSLRRLYEIAEVLEINPLLLMPPSRYGLGIDLFKNWGPVFKVAKYFREKFSLRRPDTVN